MAQRLRVFWRRPRRDLPLRPLPLGYYEPPPAVPEAASFSVSAIRRRKTSYVTFGTSSVAGTVEQPTEANVVGGRLPQTFATSFRRKLNTLTLGYYEPPAAPAEPPVSAWFRPAQPHEIRRQNVTNHALVVPAAVIEYDPNVFAQDPGPREPFVIRYSTGRKLLQPYQIPWAQPPPAATPDFLQPPRPLKRRKTRFASPDEPSVAGEVDVPIDSEVEPGSVAPTYRRTGYKALTTASLPWISPPPAATPDFLRPPRALFKLATRYRSLGGFSAQEAPQPAPAPYPSWLPPKANSITFRRQRRDAVPLAWAAPVTPPYLEPPKSFRTEFRRTLRIPQPLVEFAQLVVIPPEPAWRRPPQFTIAVHKQERRPIPFPFAPSVENWPAFKAPVQHRQSFTRTLQRRDTTAERTVGAAPWPAWKRPEPFKTRFERHLRVEEHKEERFPQVAPPEPAWRLPIAHRTAFTRRHLFVQHEITFPQPPPPTPEGFPSWVPPKAFKWTFERKHLHRFVHDFEFPDSAEHWPAWKPPVQLGFDFERTEQRAIPFPFAPSVENWPAFKPPVQHRQRFERKLQTVPLLVEFAQPVVVPPEPTWRRPVQLEMAFERHLRVLEHKVIFPQAPTPEFPAHIPPRAHRVSFKRTLRTAIPLPPVIPPEQPHQAYQPPRAFRVEQQRRHLHRSVNDFNFPPPPSSEDWPAWKPPETFRQSFKRTHQFAKHEVTFPQPPPPPFTVASLSSPPTFRRRKTAFTLLTPIRMPGDYDHRSQLDRIEDKICEIWQDLGLDPDNPKTITEIVTDEQWEERVAAIVKDVVKLGNIVTITRRK